MGDASDNIPGVPGIGPKTAVKILQSAGTLQAALQNPETAPSPRIQKKLEEFKQQAILSRQLVQLKADCDLPEKPSTLKRSEMDVERLRELFIELEFKSLLNHSLLRTANVEKQQVKILDSQQAVSELVEKLADVKTLCIDTETTSTDARQARLVGISLAWQADVGYYIPLAHQQGTNAPLEQALELLRPILSDHSIAKVGQNLKYDYQVFKNYAIELNGIAFDCMVAAYLIEPGTRQYGLNELAMQYLHQSITPIETLIGKKGKNQKSFATVPIQDAAAYAVEDVVIPLQLKPIFEEKLQKRGVRQLFEEIELPLVRVLADMEYAGIAIDTRRLESLQVQYKESLQETEEKIFELAGESFNLNSPKQVAAVFFDKLGLPHARKTKTGYSTDVDTLQKLAAEYPIAELLLQYRETSKLLSTYIEALPLAINPASKRVHTSFTQTIAATGRLSSIHPNLQNIPIRTQAGARIREAFVSGKNMQLVAADYSQIELRLLAHFSEDPTLLEAFNADTDIHAQTAAAMYGIAISDVSSQQRRSAKTINFGLMYGMGPVRLSAQLGISFGEARDFIDLYFKQFPKVLCFIESAKERARSSEYCETLFGRRRYLPDINSSNRRLRESAERIAVNMPVQGTAADIIKKAMIQIHRQLPDAFADCTMLLQVHDELIFEIPDAQVDQFIPWVRERMEQSIKLAVPLKVDVGAGGNWRQAH